MNELKQKIVKVKPLIRARKAQLDQQATELAKVRQFKADCLDNLDTAQRAYIEGVDMLNRQRQGQISSSMEVYERGLDFVKDKWYRAMAEVREAEKEEQRQLSFVIEAQRNLKAMESLNDKYQEDLNHAMNKKEQAELDEVSTRILKGQN